MTNFVYGCLETRGGSLPHWLKSPHPPLHFLINDNVALNWQGGVIDNLLAETINSPYMGHTKHNKFLILIYIQHVTHVFCIVGYVVQILGTLQYKNINIKINLF